MDSVEVKTSKRSNIRTEQSEGASCTSGTLQCNASAWNVAERCDRTAWRYPKIGPHSRMSHSITCSESTPWCRNLQTVNVPSDISFSMYGTLVDSQSDVSVWIVYFARYPLGKYVCFSPVVLGWNRVFAVALFLESGIDGANICLRDRRIGDRYEFIKRLYLYV